MKSPLDAFPKVIVTCAECGERMNAADFHVMHRCGNALTPDNCKIVKEES